MAARTLCKADSSNNLPEPSPLVLTEAIRARVLGRGPWRGPGGGRNLATGMRESASAAMHSRCWIAP